MAYYDTIYLVKGDTLPELNLTITDSNDNDAPIDLTNVTVRLKFRALGSTDIKNTINMTVLSPAADGKVIMQWPAGSLDTAGTFTGEIELEYSSGDVQTVYDQMKFKVREDY